jgi:uridine phosphorylase
MSDLQSITSAKAFIEHGLASQGLILDDVRLENTAVLAFKNLWALIRGKTGLEEFHHQLLSGAYICNGVLFVEGRISSPAMALQTELLLALGVRKIIYMGIAGAISPDLKVGDIVLSTGAVNETGTGVCYGYDFYSVIPASGELCDNVERRLKARDIRPYKSTHWCTDAPYRETMGKVKEFAKAGAVCVEMEAAGLFAVCNHYNISSAAVFVISDELRETGWVQGWADPRLKESLAGLADAMIGMSTDLRAWR